MHNLQCNVFVLLQQAQLHSWHSQPSIVGRTVNVHILAALAIIKHQDIKMMQPLQTSKTEARDNGRKNKMGHVVVPLMGRFKNETGERNLVLVLANETKGGLKVRKWIDRFMVLRKLEDQGSLTGPAICDEKGMVLERNIINDELHALCR